MRFRRRILGLMIVLGAIPLPSHATGQEVRNASATPARPGEDDELELVFAYGSEKQKWIEAVTRRFNDSRPRLASGRPFRVAAAPVGSGELIDEVLTARRKAHLVSPAAAAFILIGNAASREQGKGDLIGPTRELVSSPIVVAMWREMAEAAGWPRKSIRWRDVFEYGRDPEQWKAIRKPEWGEFKFGHTHPDFSNSGLHALIAEAYAAAGKFEDVTRRDLVGDLDHIGRYLHEVETSVVHYGSSTGFLAQKMQAQGPGYLSAAVLYENLVIEANQEARRRDPTAELPRVVAIYPAEGTFPCEHPAGVVLRDWVTPDHREAAEAYLAFLTARPQQEEARRSGFRPADRSIDPGDLLAPEMGVDPAQPRRLLRPPPASAINLIRDLWHKNKWHADIVLAVDTSASMKGDKIRNAETAAKEFVDMLGEGDSLSTMIFGAEVEWLDKDLNMGPEGKADARKSIDGLIPDGDTALYLAIHEAHEFLKARDPGRIRAVVVLSDGNDTRKSPTLPELLQEVRGEDASKPIYVFTVGYGKDADPRILNMIAGATRAKYYEGLIENIRKVFTEIATFF